jgi:hypothetical protein
MERQRDELRKKVDGEEEEGAIYKGDPRGLKRKCKWH